MNFGGLPVLRGLKGRGVETVRGCERSIRGGNLHVVFREGLGFRVSGSGVRV